MRFLLYLTGRTPSPFSAEPEQALDALGKRCAIKEANGVSGQWCVSGRYACSHTLRFDKGGKLAFVSKDLGSAENAAAADLLAAFISGVEPMSEATPNVSGGDYHTTPAIVVTHSLVTKDPDSQRDMVMKDILITVGQKTIQLQVNRPVGSGNAPASVVGMAVTEMLEKD